MKKKQLRKDKKEFILLYDHVILNYCFVLFTTLQFPYSILCPNLMTVQTGKGKVSYICKELIRGILTFEYEKQSKLDISYMPRVFWDKVIDFTDKLVVQCDVQAVKNTSLDNVDNDDCK